MAAAAAATQHVEWMRREVEIGDRVYGCLMSPGWHRSTGAENQFTCPSCCSLLGLWAMRLSFTMVRSRPWKVLQQTLEVFWFVFGGQSKAINSLVSVTVFCLFFWQNESDISQISTKVQLRLRSVSTEQCEAHKLRFTRIVFAFASFHLFAVQQRLQYLFFFFDYLHKHPVSSTV